MGKRKRRTNKHNNGEGEWTVGPSAEAKHRSEMIFEAYYRAQLSGRIVKDEAEWTQLMATMRKPLPVTLRFTAEPAFVARLENELKDLTARATAQLQQEAAGGDPNELIVVCIRA